MPTSDFVECVRRELFLTIELRRHTPCGLSAAVMSANSHDIHLFAAQANNDRLADIVFVHGLWGTSHSNWTHSNGFVWPEALAGHLPTCGVWSVGYAAGVTFLEQPGMTLRVRGLNLADLDLVKPKDAKSHIYAAVLDFIQQTLPDVKPSPTHHA